MTDRYASFVQSAAGRALVKRLGLPDPPRLRRHPPGDPLLPGPALLGAATGGRLAEPVARILTAAGVELARRRHRPATRTARTARWSSTPPASSTRPSCASSTTSSTRRPGPCCPAVG